MLCAARPATVVHRGGTTGSPAAYPTVGPVSPGLEISPAGVDFGRHRPAGGAQSAHRPAVSSEPDISRAPTAAWPRPQPPRSVQSDPPGRVEQWVSEWLASLPDHPSPGF